MMRIKSILIQPKLVLPKFKFWMVFIFGLILLPYLALILIKATLGKAPATTVSPVDQAMCVLNPKGQAGIIVAGDSRGLHLVIPSVLKAITGSEAINISQWIHFGGDPTTLVNVLRKYPQVLSSQPTLVYSITIDGVNDLGFKGVPIIQLIQWTPWDHLRVALERPRAYPAYFFNHATVEIRKLIRNTLTQNQFACTEDTWIPPRLVQYKGYTPFEGRKTTGFWLMPNRKQDYLLDGGNWRAFKEALEWLDQSPIEKIVLYNAPIDTAWLARTDGPVPVAMQEVFSDMLAKEAALHPKITLLDFYRHPLPGLENKHFYDQTHLNHEGAEIFTRYLGVVIRKLR